MARNIGVNFNGKHIIHPGAYSQNKSDSMGLSGSNSNRTIVFVGTSQGGSPGLVNWYSNPTDMKRDLRGGDLAIAGELAWSPSGDGAGASKVGFLRVEDAKQSKLVKDGLTAVSKGYGDYTNKIQLKLEDGTLPESKRLTAYLWMDNIMEIYDNIGPIFKVKYKGEADYAAIDVEVDSTSGKAKALKIKVGTDEQSAAEALVYDLTSGQFSLIQSIVSDIAEHPDFEASMVASGNKNIASIDLDPVSKKDIKAGYTVKAMYGDLLHQTRYGQLIDFSFNPTEKFPANFGYTYLAEGASGSAPSSWADKFDLLYGEAIDMVVPLSGNEAVHAELLRFIEFQSTEERAEMVGLFGGSLGESVDDAIGRAVNLNSNRAVLCYPGVTRKMADETTQTLAPYFTAALVAGKVAGVPVGEPVTLDYVNLVGLEKVLRADEVNRLIESGVCALEFVRQRSQKGFRIAQGITTYQADANPVYRELSVVLMADAISKELRERLEIKFAGGKGTKVTPALVKNEVQSFLDEKVRDEWIVDYKRDVQVTMNGDKIYVTYEAQPVEAVNYILITTNFYRESITAA